MFNKKISLIKLEYIEFIKNNGWKIYENASREKKKFYDLMFLEWLKNYSPLILTTFGEKDYPLSLKKWFLGLHFMNKKMDFHEWCKHKGYNVEDVKNEFSFFEIINDLNEE